MLHLRYYSQLQDTCPSVSWELLTSLKTIHQQLKYVLLLNYQADNQCILSVYCDQGYNVPYKLLLSILNSPNLYKCCDSGFFMCGFGTRRERSRSIVLCASRIALEAEKLWARIRSQREARSEGECSIFKLPIHYSSSLP